MPSNNFSRDTLHLLIRHICQQAEDGRLKESMAELGLNESDIKLFSTLNTSEVEQLSKSRVQLFKVEVNNEAIRFIKREIERIKLIDRCVECGASNHFLHEFFGLTSRNASSKRICASIDAKRIKRVANIKQTNLIIEEYLHVTESEKREMSPALYCDIYDNLKNGGNECNLKAIWFTVLDYQDDIRKMKERAKKQKENQALKNNTLSEDVQ